MIHLFKLLLITLIVLPTTAQAAEVRPTLPPTLQASYDKFANTGDESAHEAGQGLIEKVLELVEANYALEVDLSELATTAIKKIEDVDHIIPNLEKDV